MILVDCQDQTLDGFPSELANILVAIVAIVSITFYLASLSVSPNVSLSIAPGLDWHYGGLMCLQELFLHPEVNYLSERKVETQASQGLEVYLLSPSLYLVFLAC